jgi:hypothetical protein
MIRRRLGVLLATLALGLAGGTVATVASSTPAQAGTFSCNERYFLKSAFLDKYLTVNPDNKLIFGTRTFKGWWEQFQVCRDSSWDARYFVLKSEAMSAQEGAASYVKLSVTAYKVTPDPLTGAHLFEWRGDGNPYRGLRHAETGQFLTNVHPAFIMPGPDNLGWGQALLRES